MDKGRPFMISSRLEPSNQPTKPQTNQPHKGPTNIPANQQTEQPSNQTTNQTTDRPSNWPINQDSDQPTNPLTDQPTNQPTNQPGSTIQTFNNKDTKIRSSSRFWVTSFPSLLLTLLISILFMSSRLLLNIASSRFVCWSGVCIPFVHYSYMPSPSWPPVYIKLHSPYAVG